MPVDETADNRSNVFYEAINTAAEAVSDTSDTCWTPHLASQCTGNVGNTRTPMGNTGSLLTLCTGQRKRRHCGRPKRFLELIHISSASSPLIGRDNLQRGITAHRSCRLPNVCADVVACGRNTCCCPEQVMASKMAESRECACGMTATAAADVAPLAVAVEVLSGATPSAAETVEIPPASLSDWDRGPFARYSDDDTQTVWRPPTYRIPGPQPKRPFPPRVCEMCRDPHVFLTRNSYNTHLKKVHAGAGAFFSAAQDCLVFRRQRGQDRLRGNLAGRQGFVSWPVPTPVTARPTSPSPELDRLLQEATA